METVHKYCKKNENEPIECGEAAAAFQHRIRVMRVAATATTATTTAAAAAATG